MCTVVLLRRPQAPWPLLLAANRDELQSRPWRPPARHWPDRPDVVAGLDVQAGGSWLGVNDDGVVAAVLNRVGSLGPAAGKRSRGELVLEALDHADAAAAAQALVDLDPEAYRPFNLLIADARDAFWLRHAGGLPRFGYRDSSGAWREVDTTAMPGAGGTDGQPQAGGKPKVALLSAPIECRPLPEGCSMITARDLNDADLGARAPLSAAVRARRSRPTQAPTTGVPGSTCSAGARRPAPSPAMRPRTR